jgi:acetolactate synthase-1/3 small subunit
MSSHILSVLVQNRPGVLARISGLFARRGFNIDSLVVGETENRTVSRMTIVCSAEGRPLEQITKQLNKLINVLEIVELPHDEELERDLAMIGRIALVRGSGGLKSSVLTPVRTHSAS